MKTPYEVFIALRYLRAKRKQGFISIISVISIAGVAIGVMALILVLGVMTGFTDDLREKILGTNSHVVITAYGSGLKNHHEVTSLVTAIPNVVAATPFIIGTGMLSSGSNVAGVGLWGIDVASAPQVISIKESILEGDLLDLNGSGSDQGRETPGIIIGKEISKTLGLFPGSPVTVISPSGLVSPVGMVPRWKKFTVVGIFETGMYEYDTQNVYMAIPSAQDFLKMGEDVSGIAVRVDDIYRTEPVVAGITQALGDAYQVRDWKEMHRNLYSALKLEKKAMFIILILIIIVAAFSIVAMLVMMVTEKNKEIAILKSMGATSGAVMRIFMLQGLVIGIAGTLLGLAGGYGLAYLQNNFEIISLSKEVYYIPALTVKISGWDTFWVTLTAIIISFLATLYPSRQAASLDPVEALRYE
ncbi:MAG: lipoprotein-releasing ABC transporter permease subunit [Deltaproteobacteria bacterium]|nr:lipoprotein-releasing ABC transporter permease subunit [Deltaproteobacteria bacterium]